MLPEIWIKKRRKLDFVVLVEQGKRDNMERVKFSVEFR